MIKDKLSALFGLGAAEGRTGIGARDVAAATVMLGLLALVWLPAVSAEGDTALTEVSAATLPGDRVQVRLGFSAPVAEPAGFTIDRPARIALDFAGVKNALTSRSRALDVGVARSITAVEGQGRTRVIINLDTMVPYQTVVAGAEVRIVLGEAAAAAPAGTAMQPAAQQDMAEQRVVARPAGRHVQDIDFRRGDQGEGRVVVSLSEGGIVTDVYEEGGNIVVEFLETGLPAELQRRLDVTDFDTPVKFVETRARQDTVRMVITPRGNYEHLAYQADDRFTVEVRPLTRQEEERRRREEFRFTGERLSLNFQDIEVRAVLQLIADFTGLNMVASDTVGGSVTLRLHNVPWDQALDIILKTKGLDKRLEGNVLLVAPAEEIAARERLELETQEQLEVLAPLRSEIIQVNYALAENIAEILKEKRGQGRGAADTESFLSPRGSVSIDERTNMLLVQDTASKLAEIRDLVRRLDIPVRQVLIESRIVIASDDFAKDLGVRFGFTGVHDTSGGSKVITTTGGILGADSMINDAADNYASTGQPYPIGIPALPTRYNVNLPATPGRGTAGSIALALLGTDFLIDLELSALQAEGRGEVLSNPRVITSDQQEATIKQGQEIPYQEATSSGATSTSFKDAVLELKVTPRITPDDRVIMDIAVKKDEPDFSREVNGVPPIDTREVETEVLLRNGETVVLGGIFEQTKANSVERVPFFGDLPVLGHLFRRTSSIDNRSELLVFITPKVLKESLAATR